MRITDETKKLIVKQHIKMDVILNWLQRTANPIAMRDCSIMFGPYPFESNVCCVSLCFPCFYYGRTTKENACQVVPHSLAHNKMDNRQIIPACKS